MFTVKLIRTGHPVVEWPVDAATTVGEFLASKDVSTEGVSVVLNGSEASLDTPITEASQLLVAKATKGGC